MRFKSDFQWYSTSAPDPQYKRFVGRKVGLCSLIKEQMKHNPIFCFICHHVDRIRCMMRTSDAFYSLMAGNGIRCSYYLISITKGSFISEKGKADFWPNMPLSLSESILTLVWMHADGTGRRRRTYLCDCALIRVAVVRRRTFHPLRVRLYATLGYIKRWMNFRSTLQSSLSVWSFIYYREWFNPHILHLFVTK